MDEKTAEASEDEQIKAITLAAQTDTAQTALWRREQTLLENMQQIAEEARHEPDAKTLRLIAWIRANQCTTLPPFGEHPTGTTPMWNSRRVLIFTENREGTKRYLKNMLEQAIEYTDNADERIAVIDGRTSGPRREEVQRRFNTDPAKDPLRHSHRHGCRPRRLELPSPLRRLVPLRPAVESRPHRTAQRPHRPQAATGPGSALPLLRAAAAGGGSVLQVLVTKTETIKRELGSLAKVIDRRRGAPAAQRHSPPRSGQS